MMIVYYQSDERLSRVSDSERQEEIKLRLLRRLLLKGGHRNGEVKHVHIWSVSVFGAIIIHSNYIQ